MQHPRGMHNLPNTVLWIYIILLLAGGMIGYYKAKSHISLYMSVGFAVALIICGETDILNPSLNKNVINIILAALLIVFAMRWVKTKKFMPAGLMIILTVLALALRNIQF